MRHGENGTACCDEPVAGGEGDARRPETLPQQAVHPVPADPLVTAADPYVILALAAEPSRVQQGCHWNVLADFGSQPGRGCSVSVPEKPRADYDSHPEAHRCCILRPSVEWR